MTTASPRNPRRPVGIGINGLGRIGRGIFRHAVGDDEVRLHAVNDVQPDTENLRYLLEYDSVYGRGRLGLTATNGGWRTPSGVVTVSGQTTIDEVDWCSAGVDTVIDASGAGASRRQYETVLRNGVDRVIVTSASSLADHIIVPGVNEKGYDQATHRIIAASTCDGAALGPVLHQVNLAFGIESGFVTTLHPALSYQNVLDAPLSPAAAPTGSSSAYNLGRATGVNIIPKETSAAATVEEILPELRGRFGSLSFRVPTQAVTCASVWLELICPADGDAVKAALTTGAPPAVVGYTEDPVASTDFIGDPANAVVDGRLLTVSHGGRHVRLVLWYDNEAGYAAHVLRVLHTCAGLG